MASPPKRRSGVLRAVADQPVRQTRSMARIAAPTESAAELWSNKTASRGQGHSHADSARSRGLAQSDGPLETGFESSKQGREGALSAIRHRTKAAREDDEWDRTPELVPERAFGSPHKPLPSSQAPRYDFGPDSPRVHQKQQLKMESPRKGRVDDFEFELEHSLQNIRTQSSQSDVAPSGGKGHLDLGLPRSRAFHELDDLPLRPPSMPKERRAERIEPHANRSPSKKPSSIRTTVPTQPLTMPNPFKLQAEARPRSTHDEVVKRPHSTVSPSASNESIKTSGDRRTGRETSRSHIFKSARPVSSTGAMLSDPVASDLRESEEAYISRRSEQVARAKEDQVTTIASQYSPVKVVGPSEAFNRSPVRKAIDLSRLKPSPGKARRGMFLHEAEEEDGLEQGTSRESEDEPRQNATDEEEDDYVLKPGPLPASSTRRKLANLQASSNADPSTDLNSSSSLKPSTDVKQTLSSETSSALANLEASLARLTAHSHRRTGSSLPKRDEVRAAEASPPKRTLGDNRPKVLSPSKAQNGVQSNGSRFASLTNADRAGSRLDDDGVFKKPSTSLLKSRSVVQARQENPEGDLDSSRSMETSTAIADRRPPVSSFRGDLPLTRVSAVDGVANEAEVKRKAALKAARRRSMHSIVSFGGGSSFAVPKHEPANSSYALTDSSFASTGDVSGTDDPKAAEEARKAAKAARRRSMFTYVPTKREDVDGGDRSVGNLSSGLIIGGAVGTDSDGTATSERKGSQRFLRGLTVLVDVRDQDGEDASACWIDMLKGAGAKVLVRFGERQLTHIVYKSGRPGTLHSYRALPEPKPLVVGISWVVKCLEEGRRVEEEPFIVEVGKQALFQKRRRSSMAPRQAPISAPRSPLQAEQQQKDLASARQRLLAHAPLVPSPLRWRCFQAGEASSENDDASSTDDVVLKKGSFVSASA